MMTHCTPVFHERILSSLLHIKILLQLPSFQLLTSKGEVKAGSDMIIMADMTAHPRIHTGIANGLLDIGKCLGIKIVKIVPGGGGFAYVAHHSAIHQIISHMRKIIFGFLKRLAWALPKAKPTMFPENMGGLPTLHMEGIIITLIGGGHHAALRKVKAFNCPKIPLHQCTYLCLKAYFRLLEGCTQGRLARVI